MTLAEYSYLAEIIGGIVLIATLIFLSIQVRQNSSMLRSMATHSAHAEYAAHFQPFVEDLSFVDIYMRAANDPSLLSPQETVKLNAWWLQGLFRGQNWYHQTREGALDPNILESYDRLLQEVAQTEMYQNFWRQRNFVVGDKYREYLEELFSKAPANVYRPFGVSTTSGDST